jgi:signal transduction histidine kinase
MGTRRTRLMIIACLSLICVFLLVRDASDAFTLFSSGTAPLLFGFSALVTAIYLAIGSVVWLYASNRLVALLLFGYAITMAITFAVETGATNGDLLLSLVTSVSSLLTLALLNSLLLVFPRNALAPAGAGDVRPPAGVWRGYLCFLVALCVVAVVGTLIHFLSPHAGSSWIPIAVFSYVSFSLCGAGASLILSYLNAPTLRERQQLRLLVGGGILAIAPFLLLTVLPHLLSFLLGLSPQLAVDSRISTTTLAILPIALGYSILRYQLLVFDASIRRVAVGLVGLLSLAVTAYLVVAGSLLAFPDAEPQQAGFVILSLIVVGSGVWWFARSATERLFFSEITHYRRLLDHPDRLVRQISDLNEAAWLIAAAVVDAFETTAVGLFILDEEAGCFRPFFPIGENKPASDRLLAQLFTYIPPVVVTGKQTDWLDPANPMISRLALVSRPLSLNELRQLVLQERANLPHLLPNTRGGEADLLLVPVRVSGGAQGSWGGHPPVASQPGPVALPAGMTVGILVVGARGDLEAYAGPDFEVIDLIISRFAPVLEIARSYARGSTYAALVMKLYTGMPKLSFDQYASLEEVARSYARVAASATSSRAEVWLVGGAEGEQVLRPFLQIGTGPSLTGLDSLRVADLGDAARRSTFATWHPSQRFSELILSRGGAAAPADDGGAFPYALLPLVSAERLHGVLGLAYGRPHTFSEGEQRLLEVFAQQFATTLEGVKSALELGRAYTSQLEEDRLRDKLLQAASESLRVSLTTIGAYIELLGDQGQQLPPEARAEFLARSQRGASALALMINQLMDGVLLPQERKPLSLHPLPLLTAVRDVVELRAGSIQRELRAVRIDAIPAGLHVLADMMRVRQILLSLLDNALAHSPPGSAIEFTAMQEGEGVVVRVRDHGPGVPAGDQEHLFTPFAQVGTAEAFGHAGAELGLYVSKQLLAAMGGDLWFERSVPDGTGSVFAFSLPSADRQRSPREGAHVPD